MTFKDLGIIEPILKALEAEGYTHPTPIQEQSIPILLNRKDLLGCAQTGTGKTAAFSIPIIQHIHNSKIHVKGRRKITALIVTPTRELAIQIDENCTKYSRFTHVNNTVIFGGVKQGPQTNALRNGIDILVATPGRLLDLMNQGYISLKDIKHCVLDEADHMLDMGFIHDIRKIIAALPDKRQSLFFSATMPQSIVKLSHSILGNPEKVTIKPKQATAEKVEQALYYLSKKSKTKLLTHIIQENDIDSVLVFSRTKHGANKIVKQLGKVQIKAEAIHGNKSQGARQRALDNFKNRDTRVLIATDIAARGIDIDELELVINYDLPNIPETYVHRIGRTGRAKKSGLAISFCNIEERAYLKDIQKLIDQKIPVVTKHPFADEVEEMPTKKKPTRGQRNFNKPLKRTKDSDNKANRSKDKRERNKNNSNNNNEIRTFGESKNQNTKFNSRRRNKK
ncbi:MAG: DEAD/DEAH box helicase [Bacteroidetes bacterium MED-G21]|nr:MAG: DEAD/DEAH box helicase [Bacteroidetes bacterium MED-G21]